MATKRDRQARPPKAGATGSRPRRGSQEPSARPRPGGSVQAGELLTLTELKRRLGWGEHAVRQARRAGLRLIAFGSAKYCLGDDLLSFFARLAEEQAGSNGHQAGDGNGQAEGDPA